MESFDADAALLKYFAMFDPEMRTVTTPFRDVDEQLEGIKSELGIDQGWCADSEAAKERVDVVGHKQALAMLLQDWVEDVDDATWSGPLHWGDFLQSTGKSTKNSEVMIRQHTMKEKAIKSIHLID